MDPSNDKHKGFPTTVDVGGELFDLLGTHDVSASHKGYDTFKKTFTTSRYGDLDVEYLLRRYLYVGHDIEKITFDQPTDRFDLIKVIKKRIQQLKESKEFSSQFVKNIPIQRFKDQLENYVLPELIKGSRLKRTTVPKLTENEIFQTILEISWYLAHPNEVPQVMENEWTVVLNQLKELRITDLVKTIRQLEEEKGIPHEDKPIRYFKKLDMDRVTSSSTLEGALDRIKKMVTVVNSEPIKPQMEQRLRNLVNVLQIKQYVDGSEPVNNSGIPIINTRRLSSNLMSNPRGAASASSSNEETPQKGGNSKVISTLSAPLGQAILPIFDYLKMLYDPIYGILEKGITSSVQRAVLPHILLLLHLCNEFNAPSTAVKREFGLYHIKNISEEARTFLSEQIQKLNQATYEMSTDEEREIFRKQLFELPNLRLRSLVKNDGTLPTGVNQQQSIFHLQFFVVGGNLEIPSQDEFREKNPDIDTSVYPVLKDSFPQGSVFLCYTDASTKYEDIPFQLFEVDFNEIKVNDPTIAIRPFSEKMDTLIKNDLIKEDKRILDQLLTIKPYLHYNYPQLALSVLLALKQRMPK
jgi:hypothetical protein